MENNPIKYSDLVQPDGSIDGLIKALQEANEAYQDFIKTIKSDAKAFQNAMKGKSGATAEQRDEIENAAKEIEKLKSQYEKLNKQIGENSAELIGLKKKKAESARITKLEIQLNESAEGSYNKLSAQYSLNKIALNQMGEATEDARKKKRALEEQSASLFEKMNQLQKATGKHSLEVGGYEKAINKALTGNNAFLASLVKTGAAGNDVAASLKGVTAGIKAKTAAAMKFIATPIGALLAAIGIALGIVTAAFAAVRKSIRSSEEQMARFNVLLAPVRKGLDLLLGVLQRVVGFLLSMAEGIARVLSGLSRMAERLPLVGRYFRQLNEAVAEANQLERDRYALTLRTREVELENARNTTRIAKLRKRAADEERYTAEERMEMLREAGRLEIENADRAIELQRERIRIALVLAERNENSIEQQNEINRLQKEYYNILAQSYQLRQRIYREAGRANREYQRDLRDAQRDADRAAREAEQQRRAELRAIRQAQDAQLELMEEGFDRQRIKLNRNFDRRIEDLRKQLQYEQNLTENARLAINSTIVSLEAQRIQQLEELYLEDAKNQTKYEQQRFDDTMRFEQRRIELRLAAVERGSNEEFNLRNQMLELRRQAELEANSRLEKEFQQSEEEINAMFGAQRLELIGEYEQLQLRHNLDMLGIKHDFLISESDLIHKHDEERFRFRMKLEAERLQALLDMNETALNQMSDMEVATIKNTIERIQNDIEQSERNQRFRSIWAMVGLDMNDEMKRAISDSTRFAINQMFHFLDARIRVANEAISAAGRSMDSAQRELDHQRRMAEQGFSHSAQTAQMELDLARRTYEQAQRDKEKAVQAQQRLDAIMQVSSLVTAAANIWKSLSGIPGFGQAVAIATIATMFGSFALARVRANQLTRTEAYADGHVELLRGGSHASGNDIDLGAKKDGTRRRAEGGEYFAVINKRNSAKYGGLIPDVINAFNNGTFSEKYLKAFDTKKIAVSVNASGQKAELGNLLSDVSAIRKQNERRYYSTNKGEVMEYKNLRRVTNG